LPHRAGLDQGRELPGDVVELALQPPDVLPDPAVQGPRREAEAVLLGDQHLQQLPPAGEQRIEQLRRVRGQGAGRGAHPLGEQREDRRIESVGLRELPRAPGEVPDLARIGHDDR